MEEPALTGSRTLTPCSRSGYHQGDAATAHALRSPSITVPPAAFSNDPPAAANPARVARPAMLHRGSLARKPHSLVCGPSHGHWRDAHHHVAFHITQ